MSGALLAFALCGAAAAQDADLSALEKRLRATWPAERQEAVRDLAVLDEPRAWALVLEALQDGEPRVADEAQIALGLAAGGDAKDGTETLELLLGKSGLGSKDEWVRLRVAEALGRLQTPLSAADLAKRLDDKSPRVRRALAWSVERLAKAGRLGGDASTLRPPLERLVARDADAGVRAAALVALGTLGGGAPLEKALRDEADEVRCAALIAAAGAEPGARLALTTAAASDPSRGVRAQAVEDLAALGNASAAGALAERLALEETPRLRWRIFEHLTRLSGLDYPLESPLWRSWGESLAPEWRPAPIQAAASPREGTHVAAPRFAGLPILSERVVFLIDLSGSMWKPREGGRTAKQAVDVELRKVLEALPAQAEFNLIPYTQGPLPWQERLAPATPQNVRKALEWFEGRRDSGQGNLWDALQLALRDPRADTAVVLFDGAPTGGRRWNVELMVALFAEENRFRRLAIDALLAGAPRKLVPHWRALCEASGGRALEVDLR